MTEASLLGELRLDVLGHLRGCDWYKVHDAVTKGRPDVTVTYNKCTSFVEAKLVGAGQEVPDVIRESKLQLVTASKLWRLSGGRAFYACWVVPRNKLAPLRTEVWVPARSSAFVDGVELYRAAVREHFGSFANGLFVERLRALHSPEYKP